MKKGRPKPPLCVVGTPLPPHGTLPELTPSNTTERQGYGPEIHRVARNFKT